MIKKVLFCLFLFVSPVFAEMVSFQINPPREYDFKTRKEVFSVRKKMLKKYPVFFSGDYEPTNDLDVDTLRALEEALQDFAGCAVITSHDRWFLDRLATHILAFEGDSQVVWFEGNYAEYEADKRRRLGADADIPHRIKYKTLTRS